VKLFQNGWGSH